MSGVSAVDNIGQHVVSLVGFFFLGGGPGPLSGPGPEMAAAQRAAAKNGAGPDPGPDPGPGPNH